MTDDAENARQAVADLRDEHIRPALNRCDDVLRDMPAVRPGEHAQAIGGAIWRAQMMANDLMRAIERLREACHG